MSRELWDFDESKNYILVNGYKVLNTKNADKAALLLNKIDNIILRTFFSIQFKETITPELNLLIKTPYNLQEMQLPKDQGTIIFEGLNKPKNVTHMSKEDRMGIDGKLRAKKRLIFIQLRKEKNKLKTIKDLIRLIAHELTHTAMNHVIWRDDDHDKNFKKINKIILKHLLLNI